jgi:hypothetical protein
LKTWAYSGEPGRSEVRFFDLLTVLSDTALNNLNPPDPVSARSQSGRFAIPVHEDS